MTASISARKAAGVQSSGRVAKGIERRISIAMIPDDSLLMIVRVRGPTTPARARPV